MAKLPFSVATLVLLAFLGLRFVLNGFIFVQRLDMFLGAFVLAYGVSIYGIATKNKWGYLVSGAVAIVDMSLITVSGAEMTYNMGALIGDLAILLLSVVEYMKKGKTKEKATGKKKR